MPQTFYIDHDEEIISVIGRLRHSAETENVFVFPKRALVLQSIVNLRLLQRESQRIGKKITLVTQDEIGRMLAEKAGLATQNYSDDFSQRQHHVELSTADQLAHHPQESAPEAGVSHPSLRAEAIGSDDFFAPAAPVAAPPAASQASPGGQKLRIRNASPARPPSLNSERYREAEAMRLAHPVPPAPLPQATSRPEAHFAAAPSPTKPLPPAPLPSALAPVAAADRQEAVKRFFTVPEAAARPATPLTPVSAQARPSSPVALHPRASKIFYGLGILSLLSLFGVLGYLFFPKVTVMVTPFATTQKLDLSFTGVASGDVAGADRLPVRFIEKDVSATVIQPATGNSASNSQKARGSLVIYNDFSAEPQPLVATTRLESPDGKIFRLIDSITVPGKTGAPGAVEAAVIADQPGEAYNIGPADFTIPGFKGSPKFDRFSAKSLKPMSGGAQVGSALMAIAQADLEKAEQATRTQAEETFYAELGATLQGSEAVLRESVEIVPAPSAGLPQAGTAADTFEYLRTYKIRGFILSEEALKEKLQAAAPRSVGELPVSPADIRIDFGEIASDFDKREVALRVHAEVFLAATIDEAGLQNELLGQDTPGIEALLARHPEIEKIELVFKPDWFGSSIPESPKRVTIETLAPATR